MRALHSTFLLLALASAPALAQNASQNAIQPSADGRGQLLEREQQAEGRHNQRIEHIVVEDAGSRVQELRVGGLSQCISVHPEPRTPPPAYAVRLRGAARARPGNFNESDTVTAPRVWNLRNF